MARHTALSRFTMKTISARSLGIILSVVSLMAATASCNRESNAPTWRLDSGKTLTELSNEQSADSVVVLALNPSDCLSCSGLVPNWLDWARSHPSGRLLIVLTRTPSADEETALGLGCLSILVHQAADRLRHQTGHRLIVGGGINPESPEQGFGETERDILVDDLLLGDFVLGERAHINQCST